MQPITHTVAHPEVPVGPYCYGRGGYCPHISTKTVAGVGLAWCGYLKMGSVPNGTTEDEYNALKAHYGTFPWTNPETGEVSQMLNDHPDTELSLLWDSCKECGVNDTWHEGDRDYDFRLHELTAEGWRRPFPITLRSAKAATPTERLRELVRQIKRLPTLLRPIVGDIAIEIAVPGDHGMRCRLGDEAGIIRLAAYLAKS